MDIYSYQLPPELVAQTPAVPRDSSRLLVFDTKTGQITHSIFSKIETFLPQICNLILNHTFVLPTRITLYKKTKGKVVCLLLLNESKESESIFKVIVDRKVSIGDTLYDSPEGGKVIGRIVGHDEGSVFYCEKSVKQSELEELLQSHGSTPIPPYIEDALLSEQELRIKYQAVFAQKEKTLPYGGASVAAPTASLHFTEMLLNTLIKNGKNKVPVRLDVGMGTFAPLTATQFKTGRLHRERYFIPTTSVDLLQHDMPNVAVGTTVVRTIESWNGRRMTSPCETDIFIRPGYTFKRVDHLITNFHTPNSSLMYLVQAFLEHKKASKSIQDLYKIAIAEKYRFVSFGDALLIL
jgi:S-adenosylmethionine:tRNA ribosyltransferase-isomerase